MSSTSVHDVGYEIRFASLLREERGMSFPCDAHGHVNLDEMSDAARNNYLYARALVGREFTVPSVKRRNAH